MSLQPDPGNEPRPTGLVIFDRDGVIKLARLGAGAYVDEAIQFAEELAKKK